MERKVCPVCCQRPVAVNYKDKHGHTHYRSVCDVCARAGKKDKKVPAWYKAGYRKTAQCEKCGFKFKYLEQSAVFYLDGNLKNNNHFNLKTVCLNCVQEVHRSKLPWRKSQLVPDF
jgi:hypothetical protein